MGDAEVTLDDVKARVSRIRQMAGDPEMAHSEEDDLRRDLLVAIARGECDDPVQCAAEALATEQLSFPRWCA